MSKPMSRSVRLGVESLDGRLMPAALAGTGGVTDGPPVAALVQAPAESPDALAARCHRVWTISGWRWV